MLTVRHWITDMGELVRMVGTGGEETMLPRYGVWKLAHGDRKAWVCEVSDDLQNLLDTYSLTVADVKLLRTGAGEAEENKGTR